MLIKKLKAEIEKAEMDFGLRQGWFLVSVFPISAFEKCPSQLIFVRTLQQSQFPGGGDIQSAVPQRIQQGMGISILIQVELERAQT